MMKKLRCMILISVLLMLVLLSTSGCFIFGNKLHSARALYNTYIKIDGVKSFGI